jgi:hypothetical protein
MWFVKVSYEQPARTRAQRLRTTSTIPPYGESRWFDNLEDAHEYMLMATVASHSVILYSEKEWERRKDILKMIKGEK